MPQNVDEGKYFVTRNSIASSTNNTDTYLVQISPDGKIRSCECIREEEMPCTHLICIARVTGCLPNMLSSEDSIKLWFHPCFLSSSITAAYSVLIDPAMSSVHELDADKLQPIKGIVSKGAPQTKRFASRGAATTGDKSGSTNFKKTCTNCLSTQHTRAGCNYKESLSDSDRARISIDRLHEAAVRANSVVVVRSGATHREDFGTKSNEYVSMTTLNCLLPVLIKPFHNSLFYRVLTFSYCSCLFAVFVVNLLKFTWIRGAFLLRKKKKE